MNLPSLTIRAMSLDLPAVADHPNRTPFSGVLTRVDEASDRAPHGSNGKRVKLTRAAAEAALGSLLGMGVNLADGMAGHDAQRKIGVITAATLDGNALTIAGHLFAADFPTETAAIRRDQSSLGFSFEAQNLSVESMGASVLVITACTFTGAAILTRASGAYQATSIAASADRPVTIVVEPVLMDALRRARIVQAGDGMRLSQGQYETLLSGHDTRSRIQLKSLAALAGITPRPTA